MRMFSLFVGVVSLLATAACSSAGDSRSSDKTDESENALTPFAAPGMGDKACPCNADLIVVKEEGGEVICAPSCQKHPKPGAACEDYQVVCREPEVCPCNPNLVVKGKPADHVDICGPTGPEDYLLYCPY